MQSNPNETSNPSQSYQPDQSSVGGGTQGGTLEELLICAEQFERSTGPSQDAEKWFRAESESLLHWANNSGRLLSKAELDGIIGGLRVLEAGLEHQVYFVKKLGRVVKITKPPRFGLHGDLRIYVQNALWCNLLFMDDIRLEGVVTTVDGVSLVISQPYVHGQKPTEEEITEWFTSQGCNCVSPQRWEFPDGTVVADTHQGNLLKVKSNALIPIDLHVEKLTGRNLLNLHKQ